MKRLFIAALLFVLVQLCAAGQITKKWCGSANVEFSGGLRGDAREYGYMSAGIAASYGVLLNQHYYVGLGVKPNYIFSDGDYDGFFLPVYGEFKYKSIPNVKQFGGYGVARVGYAPRNGLYSHLGFGIDYKKWEFGLGISFQHAQFEACFFDDVWIDTYNLLFGTISVGYKF